MTPAVLNGRVALVTGGSRGIGAATALALARTGAAVTVAARDGAAMNAVVDRITAGGGRAVAIPTDVTDATAVLRLVEQTVGAFGRLDIAVNNAAAGNHPPTPLADISVANFDETVATGLRGMFLAMKYQIPAMLESGGGAIVNLASTAAQTPVAGLAGYVAVKSGVVGMTRTAALDYAAAGIRVNAIAPGPIHTEQLDRAGEQGRRKVAARLPIRRIGRPEEVAAAVIWLCSDQAAFITGATLPVDGGLLAGTPPFGSAGRSDAGRAPEHLTGAGTR